MQKIEFDFRNCEEQKRKLAELADHLHQINDLSFMYAEQELRQGWQTESGVKLLNKLEALRQRLLAAEKSICLASEALQCAGIRAVQMEERAEEICNDEKK